MGWAEAITAGCAVVTAGTVVWGVSAWRREFVGKRKIELAETVLALFYEAEDVIRWIRSPLAYSDEGKSRKKGENESALQSESLNNAYVPFERYKTKEKIFADLMSLKYRMMATYGAPSGKPFDELQTVIKQIFSAARKLGTNYWPKQGRAFVNEKEAEKFERGLKKCEDIFWEPTEEDDETGRRVRKAVEKIEAITKEAVKPRVSLMSRLGQRLK